MIRSGSSKDFGTLINRKFCNIAVKNITLEAKRRKRANRTLSKVYPRKLILSLSSESPTTSMNERLKRYCFDEVGITDIRHSDYK